LKQHPTDALQVYDKLATKLRQSEEKLANTVARLVQITSAQLLEMAAFKQAPTCVKQVAEAVCVLFALKPDFEVFRRFVRVPNFLTKVSEYDLYL